MEKGHYDCCMLERAPRGVELSRYVTRRQAANIYVRPSADTTAIGPLQLASSSKVQRSLKGTRHLCCRVDDRNRDYGLSKNRVEYIEIVALRRRLEAKLAIGHPERAGGVRTSGCLATNSTATCSYSLTTSSGPERAFLCVPLANSRNVFRATFRNPCAGEYFSMFIAIDSIHARRTPAPGKPPCSSFLEPRNPRKDPLQGLRQVFFNSSWVRAP